MRNNEYYLDVTSEIKHKDFLTKSFSVKRKVKSWSLYSLLIFFTTIAFIALAFVLGYIIILGSIYISQQKVSIFSTNYNPSDLKNSGAGAFIITSLFLSVFVILLATPLAFVIGIFLTSYGAQKWWNQSARLFINVFNSTPSIIFGIIGMYLFVITWRLGHTGFSILAGILTLTIVILPTIIISMMQALDGVNNNWKLNSIALGASRLNNLRRIILPNATSGIITGIMLAFGRVMSESAPVFLTIGSSYFVPSGFFDQGRSLTTEIFILITQIGSASAQHFALSCALITLLLLLGFNLTFRACICMFQFHKKIKINMVKFLFPKRYRKYHRI